MATRRATTREDSTSKTVRRLEVEFKCDSDIQSHAANGAIGVRIDGTKQFALRNVRVDGVRNHGERGSDACGEYEAINFAKGFGVDKDIQLGYTGDNVHGVLIDYAEGVLERVTVAHLESAQGLVFDIVVYKEGSKA